jgi:hypothetical protein
MVNKCGKDVRKLYSLASGRSDAVVPLRFERSNIPHTGRGFSRVHVVPVPEYRVPLPISTLDVRNFSRLFT